ISSTHLEPLSLDNSESSAFRPDGDACLKIPTNFHLSISLSSTETLAALRVHTQACS
ncbi:hypothetical protein Csa_008695, partial [Cucumis sativus]